MLKQLKDLVGTGSPGTGDSTTPTTTPEFADYELKTPISPEVIEEAREYTDLRESDRSLIELLNTVQLYVRNHEYADRRGNAFLEKLVQNFNDPHSLREPIEIGDDELIFVVLAEGWAEIGSDLNFSDRELYAVREAHQLYADRQGHSEYGSLLNVMTIKVADSRMQNLIEVLSNAPVEHPEPQAPINQGDGSDSSPEQPSIESDLIDPDESTAFNWEEPETDLSNSARQESGESDAVDDTDLSKNSVGEAVDTLEEQRQDEGERVGGWSGPEARTERNDVDENDEEDDVGSLDDIFGE